MKNYSDMILCFILALFILSFVSKVPGNVWDEISNGKTNFSIIAQNYNSNVSEQGSMFAKSKSLQDIVPASGSEQEDQPK